MWHKLEHVSGSFSSIQNGKFATHLKMNVKTTNSTQLKKMNRRKLQNEKKSKYLKKMEKNHFCVFLQDSWKSLEDKYVYTRLAVFTWTTITSNTPRFIKNHQSEQRFQKIWIDASNFLVSSRVSKSKSIYSHLYACTTSKTSIQKNKREPILRKQEIGWVRFHLIQFDGVNAMFFHSRAITHVILKKNRHCMKSTASYGMAG